jgi:hypothetical protein
MGEGGGKVKKAIELLEKGRGYLSKAYAEIDNDVDVVVGNLNMVEMAINAALSALQAPRRETPEQWEKRTGEKWPDVWAVYIRWREKGVYTRWSACGYEDAKAASYVDLKYIICATEAGPPPDNWEPEA